MRRLIVPLFVAAALAAGCDDRYCSPGATRACTCDSSGRNGRENCEATGAAFGPCDCTEAACEPAATRTCRGDHLFGVDACGNVAEVPAERCVCPCVENATSCPAWSAPATMRIPGSCTDDTACLSLEFPACEQDGSLWWTGVNAVNTCDHEIRCYLHAAMVSIGASNGGYWEYWERICIAPPLWPSLPPGAGIKNGTGFDTVEECRAVRDAWLASSTHYYACVRADDPAETCLPDLPDHRVCPPPDLAPVCGSP
jgi:hypothetical protein